MTDSEMLDRLLKFFWIGKDTGQLHFIFNPHAAIGDRDEELENAIRDRIKTKRNTHVK